MCQCPILFAKSLKFKPFVLPFPIKSHQKKTQLILLLISLWFISWSPLRQNESFEECSKYRIMMIPNNYLTGSKIPELIINQQGFSSRHNLPLSLGDSSLAAWGVSVAALTLRRIPWKLWKKCLQWKWWEYQSAKSPPFGNSGSLWEYMRITPFFWRYPPLWDNPEDLLWALVDPTNRTCWTCSVLHMIHGEEENRRCSPTVIGHWWQIPAI